MSQFYSGRNGRVTVAGVNVKVKKWKVTPKAPKGDTTNSETGGFATYIGQYIDGDFEFEGEYEVNRSPALGVTLAVGQLANGSFYFDATGAAGMGVAAQPIAGAYLSVTLYIEEFPTSSEAKGMVTFTCTGAVSGTWNPSST